MGVIDSLSVLLPALCLFLSPNVELADAGSLGYKVFQKPNAKKFLPVKLVRFVLRYQNGL
jgi:hypothetical protein